MPNPYTVTVGVSDQRHNIKAGSLQFTHSLQSRGSIDFVTQDATYKPSKWQPVTVEKDGNIIARGVVTLPPYGGIAGAGTTAIETHTACGDLKTHWEKRRLTAVIAEGTMKAALQNAAFADIYTAQGFALDQADDGPTVGPFDFQNVWLFDAIKAICDACDPIRVIQLDIDTLEFRLIEPSIGNLPAPWNISDANAKQNVDGDLSVEPNGNLEANNVIVEFGSPTDKRITDTFPPADGSTDEFHLSYRIGGPIPGTATGMVGRGSVELNGLSDLLGSVGSGLKWEYDESDPLDPFIRYTPGNTPAGSVTSMQYAPRYPAQVSASDAPSIADIGQIDYTVKAPNLYSKAKALEIAVRTRDAMLGGARIVRYPTVREGLREGMTQHIQYTPRDIDADCLITDVQGQDRGGDALVYQITAVEGGIPPKPWTDTEKGSSAGGGGGSNVTPPSPGSTSGGTDVGGGGFGGGIPGGDCDCCQSVDWSLSDAEIKAVPTTFKLIVPPPGENKIIIFVRAAGVVNKAGGDYTNINAGQGWVFAYGPTWSQGDASDYCGLDAREFMSWGPCPDNLIGTAPNEFLRQYPDSIGALANQVNQGLYLVGWNDGGNYGGGSPANFAFGRVCFFILDVPPTPVVLTSCTTTVWDDDFESGSSLATDYDGVLDVAKTAGVGFGGSQGLAGTGSESEAFFGYVTKIVAKDNRRGCVTCKIKPDTTTVENETEFQIIRVSSTTDTSFAPQFNIELNCGGGGVLAGAVGFNVRGDPNIFSNEITGVLVNGVWVEFRIEWEMSSVSGGVRQSDGWAKLFVDGTLAYEVSGILLNDPDPSWATNNASNFWQLVQFCPLGLGDDLLIGKP